MIVRTKDRHKLGTIEYVAVIWEIDEANQWAIDSHSDRDQQVVERWALDRLRTLQRNRTVVGVWYRANLERFRYVDYTFVDAEGGTVEDVAREPDLAFRSHSDGVTWYDDHEPGGPRWEA